jgi:hypothetical protein
MSHANASDKPAPAAAPSTAAITGLGQSRTARTIDISVNHDNR